jgi:hypothetical protein
MKNTLLFLLLSYGVVVGAEPRVDNLESSLKNIRRSWVTDRHVHKTSVDEYLRLLSQYDAADDKRQILSDLLEMLHMEPHIFPKEVITYAPQLLALNPEPVVAVQAQEAWAHAIRSGNLDSTDSREQWAQHEVAIMQIALRVLGPVRKSEVIPYPSTVHYINATPSKAEEKRRFDAHSAKQRADATNYVQLTDLLRHLTNASGILHAAYQNDRASLETLVHRQVPDKEEAEALITVLFPEP